MLLAHAQLLDSALPIGGFAHSFGLESLVLDGTVTDAAGVGAYVTGMLHGCWAPADALAGIAGPHRLLPLADWDGVVRLDRELDASRLAAESRIGSRRMGRELVRLASRIHPDVDLTALDAAHPTHSVAWGALTFLLGIDERDAAHGYLYACVTAATGAAVRLGIMGQADAQAIIAGSLAEIADAWEGAGSRNPFDFASCVPAADHAAIAHASLDRRLFMS